MFEQGDGPPLDPAARRVTRKRLGILGLGRAVARRAEAFATRVCCTDVRAAEGVSYRFLPDLVDLAREVDALVVAAPGGAGSKHLVNPRYEMR